MRALVVAVCAVLLFVVDGSCAGSAPPQADNRKRVLFVVGMDDEERIAAAGDDVIVVKSGANRARLEERLAHVDRSRIRAVVSFGVAGALRPTLLPGEIVIADHIVANAASRADTLVIWRTDPALTAALSAAVRRAGAHAHRVGFFGVDTMTSSPADRARMFAAGAGAVDMESHVAAAWAQDNGLPFAALRTISDGVTFVVPPAMEHSINADGSVDVGAVVGGVVADPSQVRALLVAGDGYGKAMRALQRCREKMSL